MYFVILLVFSAIVVWVSKESSMLRNELFNEENFCKIAEAKNLKNPRPAFSLGRTQLAFWTVIVMSSFIYILYKNSVYNDGAITIPDLNDVGLALLGIAAGTTLVSKVIDTSQKENQGSAISQQDYPSKGFLTDIISDEKGVSIHRLQNVVWTIIVGAIYISYTYQQSLQAGQMLLPDSTIITTNLFALMGISTGAYLGLKLNENKNAPVNEATTNTENPALPVPPPAPQVPQPMLSDSGDQE